MKTRNKEQYLSSETVFEQNISQDKVLGHLILASPDVQT